MSETLHLTPEDLLNKILALSADDYEKLIEARREKDEQERAQNLVFRH